MSNCINMGEIRNMSDLELLFSLKKLKKDGTLDLDEFFQSQEHKWRNSLDYKTIENWLTCDSEELRLQTLELLTISKKSTLTFTEQELKLVILFLRYNLRDKIEHVPLIKKILKRLNDSYAVFKRQLEKETKLKELQKIHPEFTIPPDELNAAAGVKFYLEFVMSLHRICLENLYPGAVNVRKKSCLQILCLMDEFLSEDLKINLWTLDDFRQLFDCLLLDTYEINKDMAFRLIKSCNLIGLYFNTKEKIVELVDIAIQLGNSIRPLDSITAAYMLRISMLSPNIQEVLLELIKFREVNCIQEKSAFYMITLLKESLEKPVKSAIANIVIAASKHSLYGYVFCIQSILSTINLKVIVNDKCWRTVLADIVNMCFDLNKAVSQIVNNSSPEGHLPMDLNPRHLDSMIQDMEEVIITPQMVLLCSWRTVKEISLLFGYLTSHASIFNEKTGNGLLTESQIKGIGNQFVTLLCETKHRGAFEQAHVGFGQLCSRLWHLDKEQASLNELPKVWLQQLLLAVIGFTTENSKLCATRRSAGVPFMVQALVTSQIKKRCDTKLLVFHSVMKILLKLVNVEKDFNLNEVKNILLNEMLFKGYEKIHDTNDLAEKGNKLNEITEIKTHALNILRALYRHCLLGDLVKDYIAEGFIVAFKCYGGESWAERNAATLLFSSLVVRVFGVQRTKDHLNLTLHNRMTGRNFFEKFPILLPFLLDELTIFINDSEDQIKPKIQSILLILSRLYPCASSDESDDDWNIIEFIDLVSKCGKSRVYKTRELTARALVPLLTKSNVLFISINLLNLITRSKPSLNLMHGYALQLLEIVRCPQFTEIELPNEELKIFIDFLNKSVLHNLESTNNNPACFPVSTATLEILIELSKMDLYRWIFIDSQSLNLIEKIKLHLTDNKILKKRPGIELYELTAVTLIITSWNTQHDTALRSNEYVDADFWESILKHKNVDVLTITWSKLLCIIQKTKSRMLYDRVFMTAIMNLDKCLDPDLQDAIYDFLYNTIKDVDEDIEYTPIRVVKNSMCFYIFKTLCSQLEMIFPLGEKFYARGTFFKLFGKSFGFLLRNYEDGYISTESKTIIYNAFLNQSNMESNFDCRTGISEVLFDLYIDMTKKNDIYYILVWWTILLQLLYDDNAEIRSNAAQIVCKLPPETKLNCEAIIIDTFFSKFVSIVGQSLEPVLAAFFCWSMTTAAVVLEEMDETDVFNKSCNYECFEPLQITNLCVKHLKNINFKGSSTKPLCKSIKAWLQTQLNLDDTFKFDSLTELIIKYREIIPGTEEPLKRILDPTYPAKLVKEIAYVELKNAVIHENGLASLN